MKRTTGARAHTLFAWVPLVLWAAMPLAGAGTPTQMEAVITPPGSGAENWQLQRIAVPMPGAGEVLVRVYAAALNPVDWKMPAVREDQPARIPGRDISGVIVKLGPGVSQFRLGDAVWGQVEPQPNLPVNGAYAQFAVAPVADIARKPTRLSFAEASGLGIATVTGVRAIQYAQVSSGQRVLVTGAAGGVGSAAVQAAKARGAYVVGTASARHAEYLKSIGVDEPVDYTSGDWASRVQDMNAVIDTVSPANATQALQTLKAGGRLVYVAGAPDPAACAKAGVECQGGRLGPMNVPPPAGAPAAAASGNPVIEEILKLANSGQLIVHIDRSFPLAQAMAAQALSREGATQGKIILIVDAAHAGKK